MTSMGGVVWTMGVCDEVPGWRLWTPSPPITPSLEHRQADVRYDNQGWKKTVKKQKIVLNSLSFKKTGVFFLLKNLILL